LNHRCILLAILASLPACDRTPLEPCAGTAAKPILEITSARNAASGAPLSAISITDPVHNGVPLDTALLRTNLVWNLARTSRGFLCTLPCRFGSTPGTYTFNASTQSFYPTRVEIVANYTGIPSGCPASHGVATRIHLALREADSARVTFAFVTRTGTGLTASAAAITYNDGSGDRLIGLVPAQPTFPTANTGTMHVRVVLGAPDTLAVGEVDIPLRKDWHWAVGAWVYDRNPQSVSFCVQNVRSFPLRRAVPNADSLYLTFSGNFILNPGVC
jgi:hypothetical protein